jgi:hypothetical protein
LPRAPMVPRVRTEGPSTRPPRSDSPEEDEERTGGDRDRDRDRDRAPPPPPLDLLSVRRSSRRGESRTYDEPPREDSLTGSRVHPRRFSPRTGHSRPGIFLRPSRAAGSADRTIALALRHRTHHLWIASRRPRVSLLR